MDNDVIKVGIDLDNCITADINSENFFRVICHLLHPEHEIHIITNRDESSREATIQELKELGIQYSTLALVSKKAEYILTHKVNIYFDDTDEYFLELPEEVTVFKIREDGNYDFSAKKWIGSRKTTKLIDE
jgi:uncharacterized HAD superfamily protein